MFIYYDKIVKLYFKIKKKKENYFKSANFQLVTEMHIKLKSQLLRNLVY